VIRDNAQIAIVGCGAVVQDMYAPALKTLGGARVVAVCDLDRERAEFVGRDLGAPVKTFDEALALAGLVVVAAPPAAHFELASRALAAGCSVLCEKPFVARTSQAKELVGLAAEHGSDLFVGHFRRLNASLRTARELLASGLLGRPQSVVAMEGGRFSWQAKSAYTLSDPLGGVLYDTGSHLLDMVMFATGLDERTFEVRVQTLDKEPKAEPSHSLRAQLLIIDGEQEITVTVGLSRFELLANVIRIHCERGTLEVPTGPGTRLRIRGPAGSLVLESQDGPTALGGSFVEQMRRIVAGEDCPELAGSRFVGVTEILETVMDHGGEGA
jgi:predicted dehydrogenase